VGILSREASGSRRSNASTKCSTPTPELAAVGVGVLFDTDMEAQPIEHLDNLSCLSLGQ
jgi:hypothetical protein